jgi:hypothetical protein
MFKNYFLVVVALLFYFKAECQVFTGGEFGVHYKNGMIIEAAPVLGYKLNNYRVGVSPFLSYSMPKNSKEFYIFGARLFNQFTIFEGVYLHAEFEALNTPHLKADDKRIWLLGLPVGAGYEKEIAKNTFAYGSFLYDLLLSESSPKENPTIRAGIVHRF